MTGAVTANSLQGFREHALEVLKSINRDLKTGQNFADAEKTVKWCKEVEDKVAVAKSHTLSQTASIEEDFRLMDEVSEEIRRIGLELAKEDQLEPSNEDQDELTSTKDTVEPTQKEPVLVEPEDMNKKTVTTTQPLTPKVRYLIQVAKDKMATASSEESAL